MKKHILKFLFVAVFLFELATLKVISSHHYDSKLHFENIESMTDVELPEFEIVCDINPYWLGRCWIGRFENDRDGTGKFLGCEFIGRPDTSCMGDIYI